MVIESARMEMVEKPWGCRNLGQWQKNGYGDTPIGELWFERPRNELPDTQLLLKLLFTAQPLSIQVHPTDAFAHSLGLEHGKSEAWIVLSASEGAKVAVGLTQILTPEQLRNAIEDGSIADLVDWRVVAKGDVIFVPAGTVHALGAGLVVLEVQQRSDITFRLFDFGRGRKLDLENAVGCADRRPAGPPVVANALTDRRTLLVASRYFVVELIDLPALSLWAFSAIEEVWVFALQGDARFGEVDLMAGKAIFIDKDAVSLQVNNDGLKCLAAYPGDRPRADLLRSTKREYRDAESVEFASGLVDYATANPWLAGGAR